MCTITIVRANTVENFLTAKHLILEYAASLGMDLSFQNFNDEIEHLEKMYAEPGGGLLLAMVNGEAAGVAGIRHFQGTECELKRMFVRAQYRSLGLGRQLLSASIELAKQLNYLVIKLDTADYMTAAIKLYKDHGFVETVPYRYNPHESAKYFQLVLP